MGVLGTISLVFNGIKFETLCRNLEIRTYLQHKQTALNLCIDASVSGVTEKCNQNDWKLPRTYVNASISSRRYLRPRIYVPG